MALSAPAIATIGGLLVESRVPQSQTYPHPLIFIHGIYSGAWCFEPWLQYLAEHGFAATAVNLRGHNDGQSVAGLSIQQYAADVENVARELHTRMEQAVVLIGHSMGGLIAQLAASHIPEKIHAAVLIGSAPPAGIFLSSSSGMKHSRNRFRYIGRIVKDRTFLFDKEDIPFSACADAPDPIAAYRKLVPESTVALRQMGLGMVFVKRLRVPTLVVSPQGDKTISPIVQQKIARKHRATLLELPGQGHGFFRTEQMQHMLDKITAWLKTLPEPGGG